jgi:acetylornithine deacetylase/succinyl-diaminopimelate desuccinylase-like protein
VTLRDEVVRLTQALLRVDTVNPPGNETRAADVLRGYLEANGVACELYARDPVRANLVARLRGDDGPRLMLLSHTDTVLADGAEWQVDPWSGEVRDGAVWGRGALDMKGQVAASAVAIASLAREGFRPRGELVFAATADEEVGEDVCYGLPWLCEHHPDAVRCDYALNEGGGDRVELGGRVLYLAATAEKTSAPFRLRVHGRSGHASMPAIADNALVKAARLVARLGELRDRPRLTAETAAFLEALTGSAPPPAADALARARAVDPRAAEILDPLLAFTLAPTMVEASRQRNVIPALCDVVVDCRLLPGQTQAEVEATIRSWLGCVGYELEWIQAQGGTRSPLATPLWRAIEGFVAEVEPGSAPAPICVAGFTDSHWLRASFGAVAYGFFPARAMPPEVAARLVHAADERIPVDDLELGVRFLRHAATSLLS